MVPNDAALNCIKYVQNSISYKFFDNVMNF